MAVFNNSEDGRAYVVASHHKLLKLFVGAVVAVGASSLCGNPYSALVVLKYGEGLVGCKAAVVGGKVGPPAAVWRQHIHAIGLCGNP